MPAQRAKRPVPRPQAIGTNTPDLPSVQRALGDVLDKLPTVANRPRSSVQADLVVGDNRVAHGVGMVPRGVSLVPTVADATFAWCLKSRDDKQAVITVVGVAQPGCVLEFWA